MANKNGKKNKKNRSFNDERMKIILGIFTLFLAAFLTLAFISYFFTWKVDQSFQYSKVISGIEINVENWSGKAGAHFANLFINKWFGIASFTFPFLLIVIGLRFFNLKLFSLRKTLRITIFGTIILSVLLGYLFGDLNGYLGSGLGGGHGYFIALWLNSVLGKVGTAFLLTLCIIAFIIFSSRKSILWSQKLFAELFNKQGKTEEKYPAEEETEEQTEKKTEAEPEITEEEIDEQLIFTHRKKDQEEAVQARSTQDTETGQTGNIEISIEEKHAEDIINGTVKNYQPENYDPTLELSSYKLPPISLLEKHGDESNGEIDKEEIIANKNRIVETLANYKIQIDKIKATVGPTVTLYEIIPAPGVRISKIKNLEDDIALSLAALGIRIIAPIPGRGTIGIEVPNQNPEIVSMRSIISSKAFSETKYELAIGLGKTISNDTYVVDLTKMPHLLVAGATGQGKSVGLNAIIASLLYKKHPAQLKFVMIDPKKVELTLYTKIENHFLAKLPDSEEPIITETQKVVNTLNSLCIEMDHRYDLLKAAHVRNIKEYNTKFIARKLNPEKGHKYLPYIVVVVDEFADLIMTAGKEIEGPIARLAQLARAIGIHLIIATQRPSTNIITGVIKANFPARMAFRVSSMVDSRTILDTPGANQLIGRGDMLITSGSDLIRLQCAFIDTPELDKITDYIQSQQSFPTAFILPEYTPEGSEEIGEVDLTKRDALFEDAAKLVTRHQQGSTSLIQRKFSIGYNRAGRIIDQLEAANIVGPFEGSKARQVLFQDEYALEQYLNDFLENN
ncbi:MAG: DNA translocase FtsK 4TM domain-containing protein [Bacteroidales bacterium]|jgi:S-DNA-T family DNA segregation ATPase FtsK/SpoIIIE|nr:DNA translocase FtsK 4TM domain-containing protein [Bacteroidales bacterium]